MFDKIVNADKAILKTVADGLESAGLDRAGAVSRAAAQLGEWCTRARAAFEARFAEEHSAREAWVGALGEVHEGAAQDLLIELEALREAQVQQDAQVQPGTQSNEEENT